MSAAGDLVSGRYRLVVPVGRGGMATVWRARDEITDHDVALKRMHARVQADPDLAERFRREAKAVSRLSHPAIVRLFDEGSDDEGPYIVFELVEGTNLKALIRARGPLPPELTASVVSQVARGLELAHRSGVIHRDIKSHNVLVTDGGVAKLTDFGIARLLDADQGGLTRTGTVLGTSDYLAPEQARGLAVDGRTDVYSLGIVLYECLTGELPFPADTPMGVAQRQVRDPLPDPRTVVPSIPSYLATATLRACGKDPSSRFGSALEMSDALLDSPDGATGALPVVTFDAHVDADADTNADADEVTGAFAVPPVPENGEEGATRVRQAVISRLDTPAASTIVTHATVKPEPAIHVLRTGPDRTARWRRAPALLAALLILSLVGVAASIVWRGQGSGAGDRASQGSPSGTRAPTPGASPIPFGDFQPLPLESVHDVDPSGDGREMPNEVPLAYDGNEVTGWRTERYATPDFGGVGKKGVGLQLTLQRPAVAGRIDLITKGTGGTFLVLAGPPGTDARVVATATFENGHQSVPLEAGAPSDVYTLWITSLPPNAQGSGYRAYVAEASLG